VHSHFHLIVNHCDISQAMPKKDIIIYLFIYIYLYLSLFYLYFIFWGEEEKMNFRSVKLIVVE